MKRPILLVSVVAIGLSGCVDPAIIGFRPAQNHSVNKLASDSRPPTVQVNQINESNAHAMALALMAEIDYAASHDDEVNTPSH